MASSSSSPSPPLYTKTFPNATLFPSSLSFSTSNYSPPPSIHLSRPFAFFSTAPISRSARCHVTSSAPPPPPDPEPQPPSPSSGFSTTITRIQDTTQIFLAVLFWMSLFFWASAWDGRNGDKPNKGSRFRG